jgi:hypothetical protein
MKNPRVQICAGLLLVAASSAAPAQAQPAPQVPASSVPVTVDNFRQAESDLVMGARVASASASSVRAVARPLHQSALRRWASPFRSR